MTRSLLFALALLFAVGCSSDDADDDLSDTPDSTIDAGDDPAVDGELDDPDVEDTEP